MTCRRGYLVCGARSKGITNPRERILQLWRQHHHVGLTAVLEDRLHDSVDHRDGQRAVGAGGGDGSRAVLVVSSQSRGRTSGRERHVRQIARDRRGLASARRHIGVVGDQSQLDVTAQLFGDQQPLASQFRRAAGQADRFRGVADFANLGVDLHDVLDARRLSRRGGREVGALSGLGIGRRGERLKQPLVNNARAFSLGSVRPDWRVAGVEDSDDVAEIFARANHVISDKGRHLGSLLLKQIGHCILHPA